MAASYASLLLVFVTVCVTFSYSFDIHVEFEDDDGYVEETDYEGLIEDSPPQVLQTSDEESYDNLLPQTPYSFEQMPVLQISAGLVYNINTGWRKTRSPKLCGKNSKSVITRTSLIVEAGGNVRVPCHFCRESEITLLQGLQWLKFNTVPDKYGIYHLSEVKFDMHNHEELNRITKTLEHSLIIRNVTKKDTGSYLCRKPAKGEQVMPLDLNVHGLNNWFQTEANIHSMFHLDVLELDQDNFVEIPDNKRAPPVILDDMNLEIFNQWQPWGPCNLCDVIGERRRISLCFVKKYKPKEKVPDQYLDSLLDNTPDGLPCESELLRKYGKHKELKRHYEIVFDECLERCERTRVARAAKKTSKIISKTKSAAGKAKDTATKTINLKETLMQNKIEVIEEYFLALKCRGAKIGKNVNWLKNDVRIPRLVVKNKTNSRVSIDMRGSLNFRRTKINDTGVYRCYIGTEKKIEYSVKVKADENVVLVKWLVRLCYVNLCNTGLVFIVLVIKHTIIKRRRGPAVKKSRSHTSSSFSSSMASSWSSKSSSSITPGTNTTSVGSGSPGSFSSDSATVDPKATDSTVLNSGNFTPSPVGSETYDNESVDSGSIYLSPVISYNNEENRNSSLVDPEGFATSPVDSRSYGSESERPHFVGSSNSFSNPDDLYFNDEQRSVTSQEFGPEFIDSTCDFVDPELLQLERPDAYDNENRKYSFSE